MEFTWRYQYSWPQLVFRSFRVFVYRLAALVALVFALGSFALFILLAVPLVSHGQWQVVVPPAPGAKFLWLAVVCAGYAWYRFDRQRTWYPRLPREAEKIVVDKYLSEETWQVMEIAFHYAVRLKHAEVDPLHLLAAALRRRTGQRLMARLGVDAAKLLDVLKNALATLPRGSSPDLSAASKSALIQAARLGVERKSRHVAMSEVLVALAQGESKVKDVLEELAIPTSAVTNITAWFALRRKLLSEVTRRSKRSSYRPKHALDRAYLAVATPFLSRVSKDLTQAAAAGYLYPCVGREDEMRQVFRLIEGGRSGMVVVGEPGVGKGMLLDGIAQAMAADEVPKLLQDKHFMVLSLPQLLSGAEPAETGQRLMRVLSEVAHSGNVVLGIEDVQQLSEFGGNGEQLALGEVLANVVTRHGITVITTASRKAWRSLEGTGLGQALQAVEVAELSDDAAIQVLESRIGRHEREHHVFFCYAALEAAVKLTRRYLPEQYLPEKALTLVDEVAPYVQEHAGKHAVVTAEHVAQVMAARVHVPLTQLTQSESEKLLKLEDILCTRIVGQDEAVRLVAEALRRGRLNLRDQKRPVASFLFLGPTGVGKTELAKTVAAEYFGGEEKMIRLDMSEYQTSESLYRLVGAPAGVGDDKGLLTEAIRRNPYAIVLLDELEKAHADILNVFLQVLDDGRLTDAAGRTIDFTNTIIIATSNAGTSFIQEQMQQNTPLEKIRQALIRDQLKQYFHPEFLNRFDAIVVFKPLSVETVERVAEMLLGKLAKNLEEKGVHLRATPEAIKELAAKGFDPLFGARPLRRAIQDNVDSALAKYLLTGKLTRRDVVVLEPGGVVRVEKAEKL